MPVLRGKCEDDATGCCPGVQFYQSRRVFYNLLQRGQLNPGAQAWSQPTKISELLVGESDGNDPGQAVVTVHNVACVRELDPGGPPGIQPGGDLAGPSQQPPISTTHGSTPVPDLPCSELTVGRGTGTPQYRVTFRDGTRDGVVVYVDGGSVLSLPASQVEVEIMTSPTNFVLEPNKNTNVQTAVGLYVDAEASASISWSSRNGSAGAMGGMATFTQTQLIQDDGDPIGPTPGVILFERPPFAREVTIVPDSSLIDAGGFFFSADYVSGATRAMGAYPLGIVLGGMMTSERGILPAPVTHVRVTPLPGYTVGAPIHCVWQIGVR